MPRLWTDTIDAHRQAVRETIMETAWALVTERGPMAVTMSQVAERAGIGRATLYKYFPDVQAILLAWHERHVATHLEHLAALRARPGEPHERLAAVLRAYALICHRRQRHGAELFALLHRAGDAAPQRQITELLGGLLAEAAAAGSIRGDVAPPELAAYCTHAVSAAGDLPSAAAVDRLVAVILDGLRPAPAAG